MLGDEQGDDLWSLIYLAIRLDRVVRRACEAGFDGPKRASQLAQKFNVFYHNDRLSSETDRVRRPLLIAIAEIVERQLQQALGLMRIEVPERV